MKEAVATSRANPSDCTEAQAEIRHVKLNKSGTVSDLAKFFNEISSQDASSSTDIRAQMKNRANSSAITEQNIISSSADKTHVNSPEANNTEEARLEILVAPSVPHKDEMLPNLNDDCNNNSKPQVNSETYVKDKSVRVSLNEVTIKENNMDSQNIALTDNDALPKEEVIENENKESVFLDTGKEDDLESVEVSSNVYVVPLNVGLEDSQRKIGQDEDLTKEIVAKATEATEKKKSKKKSKRSKNEGEPKSKKSRKGKEKDIKKRE